jgi:selenocysteine-specific elongation factor
LRLSEPALLLPGDRFIIRQFSPVITIGGGVVLDALPIPQKLKPEEITAFLQTMAQGSPAEILEARAARRAGGGLRLSEIQAEMNISKRKAAELIAHLPSLRLITGDDWTIISTTAFNRVMEEIVASVSQFHDANPLKPGIGKEELRDRVNLNPDVFYSAMQKLSELKKLGTAGEQVRLPGRGVVMKDEEAEAKKTIESAFSTAGLKVPALKDVLAALQVDKSRAQKIVTLLLRDKVLIKIADDLVFHHSALGDLKRQLAQYKSKSPKINVAQFKDLTGVSRKYAIPLLEFLDRERVTRRVGDERIIL